MTIQFREGSQEIITLPMSFVPQVGWTLRIEGDPFVVIGVEMRVVSGEVTLLAQVSRIVVPKSTR